MEGLPPLRTVNLRDALSETLALLKGSKSAILLGVACLLLANMLALLFSSIVSPGSLSGLPTLLDNVVLGLLGAVVSSPILGGFALMTLMRARGEAIDAGMIFRGTAFATRFLTYGLITTALSALTFLLPPLAGNLLWLGVGVLLSFTSYFIVDRDMGAGQAVTASLRMVAANLGPVLLWVLLGVALTVVAALTLGIALIWVVPFLAVSNAMLYLHALGDEPAATAQPY